MRKTITLFCLFYCLLAAGSLLAGCVNIKADASGMGGDDGARHNSAPPPDAAADSRSIGDLQRENAQLRERLVKLEKAHDAWQAAIDRQKDEISDLKRQRDDLKKDRDRAKKALKQSEK